MKTTKNEINHNFYEKLAWKNKLFVCGVDEVGRGCLAGPLVVAATILPQNCKYPLLLDSKKITANQRDTAFDWISKNCIYSVSYITPKIIDEINIYQATILAMNKAIIQLFGSISKEQFEKVKYLLIDAVPLQIPTSSKPQTLEIYNFNYGETYSKSIAAASIVAKVIRDRLMTQINNIFPNYGFEEHKGYGTTKHLKALNIQEKSIIHRNSFLKNFKNKEELQSSLF